MWRVLIGAAAAVCSLALVAPALAAPGATLSPSSLSFADRAVGTTADAQAVQVTNTGDAPLAISTIGLVGANPGDFGQGALCPISPDTIPVGGSCTIYVSFTPRASGARTASLAIGDNAPSSPQTVALGGGGLVSPQLAVSPGSLSFGSTEAGDHTASQTVTISNVGSIAAVVSSVALTGAAAGEFSAISTCDPITGIAVGGSCTVDVAFAPRTPGAKSAQLTVTDNAVGSPHTVALSGTGTPPPTPQLASDPSALAFGALSVGSSATQSLTLSNAGGAPLSISGVSIGGPAAADFTETDSCGTTLAPGGSCPVTVTFAPTVGGSRAASLLVADNASGSPQAIALSGSALDSGTYLTDDFEAGLGQWDALSSSDSSIALDSSVANSGSSSVRFTNSSDEQSSRLMADLAGGGHAQTYTRFCFRISAGVTAGMEIANGRAITEEYPLGIRRWEIVYNPVTKGLEGYFFDENLDRLDMYAANGLVLPERWYCAELYLDESANGHARLWLDGSPVGAVDGDLSTPSPFSRMYLWDQPSAGSVWFDDVQVSASQIGTVGAGSGSLPGPQVSLSPSSLGFGTEQVQTATPSQTVTVTNTGQTPLSIGSVGLSGAAASDYVETSGCALAPATIAPGGSCSIAVAFDPTAEGTRSAVLTIADNAAQSPQSVALTGVGTDPGTYLTDDFEAGLGQWDALSSSDSTIALDSTVAHSGSSSVRFTNSSDDQSSRLMADLAGGGHAQTYTRFCFRIAPGVADGIEIANGRAITDEYPLGIRRFVIDYNPQTEGLEAYFFNENLDRLDMTAGTGHVLTGQWYCAELYLDESVNGHARLWLDGSLAGSVDGDLSTPGTYSRFYLWNQASAGSVWFDDVEVAATPIGTLDGGTGGGGGGGSGGGGSSAPAVTTAPTALSFSSQPVGATSAPQSVTITNSGNAALALTGVTVTGAAAGDFAESDSCPASLAAGASCTASVTFSPTATGTRAAALSIADNAAGAPQSVALAGVALAAGTYLTDDFEAGDGQWDPLSSSDSSIAVDTSTANSGAASVRFTNSSDDQSSRLMADLAGGGHAQTYTRFCFDIAPGLTDGIEIANGRAITAEYPLGIRRFVIDYNPQTKGLEAYFFNENLDRLDMTAGTGRVLTGRWYCAELYLDESASGHARLWLDGVLVGSVDGDLSTPGLYSRFYLWNQAVAGTVWFDDIAVSANPIGPVGAGAADLPGPKVSLAPASIDFGSQTTQTTSGARTVTVTNTGDSTLTIGGVSVGGANASDFAETSACPATLGAGASCTVSVTFSPTAAGARSASLAISDDASGTPHTVALSGTGTAPDAAVATLSATSLSFPAEPAGTAAPSQNVTLTNTGTLPLSISHIALGGAAPGDFAESDTCPSGASTLGVGAGCTITIGFTPAATGARAATLTIDSNAVDGSVSVSLAGTGTLPAGTFLSDGFEAGLGGWHTIGDGTISTESTTVHGGAAAASLTNGYAGGYSGLYADFTATTAETHTRFCFSLSGITAPTVLGQGRDANGLNLWEIDYDPGLGGLDLYFWNGARARTDLYTSLHAVSLDHWSCLDVDYDAASGGHIAAWLDGQAIGSVTGDYTLTDPYSRLFLWNNGAAGTVDLDDVSVTSS